MALLASIVIALVTHTVKSSESDAPSGRAGPSALLWSYIKLRPELFSLEAVLILQGLGRRFPPMVKIAHGSALGHPDYCGGNKSGLLDAPAYIFPQMARRMSAATASNDCALPDCFHIIPNCLGKQLNDMRQLWFRPDMWQGIRASIAQPLKRWVRTWPNGTGAVVITEDKGRLLSPFFDTAPASATAFVSYMGDSYWIRRHGAHGFTEGLAQAAGAKPPKSWYRGGCSAVRSATATGDQTYDHPANWQQDVVIQHMTPYHPRKHWVGPANRDRLAVFVGSGTHCTRRELFRLWASQQNSRIYARKAVGEKREYSQLLQSSKFCLVMDGHLPCTIRLLDSLVHGCVPVIVSEAFHPPLDRLLNWLGAPDGFPAIFVHPKWIPQLDVLLSAIPDSLWLRMQAATWHLSFLLDLRWMVAHAALLAELVLSRNGTAVL